MNTLSQTFRHRALYLSHGAGPMPVLGDDGHRAMVDCLKMIATQIPKPSAILLVSAHWEEPVPTITSAEHPPLFFDYYGFPAQAYEIDYPACGMPALATAVHSALSDAGIASRLDDKRGFDHGMFVPMKLMYPEADVPCVQLSLINTLNPVDHIAMGKAVSGLAYDNLLVIGSGFSFHNMRAFFKPDTPESVMQNTEYIQWLNETCSSNKLTEDQRNQRLAQWAKAPSARYCHPREEHFLPLHVCYGVAGGPCNDFFDLEIIGKKAGAYLW